MVLGLEGKFYRFCYNQGLAIRDIKKHPRSQEYIAHLKNEYSRSK